MEQKLNSKLLPNVKPKLKRNFLEETARLQGGGLPGLKQQLEEARPFVNHYNLH